MAEEGGQEVVDVEEWVEQVDVSALGDDGPSTIFVGGFSALQTATEGLAAVKYRDDRVVVLAGNYAGDLVVDSTRLDGVDVRGEGVVTFEGRLIVEYTSFDPEKALRVPQAAEGADDAAAVAPAEGEDAPPPEEEPEEGEEGGKQEPLRPQRLTIGNMSFLSGLLAEGLSTGYIDDCTFGSPIGALPLTHCGVVKALTTVACARCKFFGNGKAVLYGFPRSRASFTDCTFGGAVKPRSDSENVRRKRGYVPPPPPPPTAPASTECDVGLYLDDASNTFAKCVVSHVGIGVLCRDECKGTLIEDCAVSLTSATGVLLLDKSCPRIARTSVSLNGRESLVVGNHSHPNVRKCNFVGDVRLKTQAIHTGLSDNVVGLSHQVIVEGTNFSIKGFTVIATDPTIVKPKKAVAADEE